MDTRGIDTRTKTLIGAPVGRREDALTGFATGKRQERPQSIFTPQPIIDVCLAVWPEGIALDPCWNEGCIVPAQQHYTETDNGLLLPWQPRTFINPPYNGLKAWMSKGVREPYEQIWLVPVRTHRKWWRQFASTADVICWMDSGLKFLGYDAAFPAPLALMYRGNRVFKFRDVASGLGEIRTW